MVKAIWFADDQAMVADTEKGLRELMGVMQATPKDYSMTINPKKTKVMHISRKRGRPLIITVDGTKLEQVMQFIYLGRLIKRGWSVQ